MFSSKCLNWICVCRPLSSLCYCAQTLHKLLNVNNMHLTDMVKTLIENRRFFVELSGKKCRWRRKHSGQTLFNIHGRRSVIDTYSSGGEGVIRKYLRAAHVNIYVNDQPISTLRPGVSSIRRPVYHHHPQSVTHMIGKTCTSSCSLNGPYMTVMTSLRQNPPCVRDLPTYPCTPSRTI